MEWFVLRSAAAVILPDSNRVVGPFMHFKEKVSIIHLCPPDLQSVNEYRRNHPTFTICAMGNLTRRRGIELLLEASRKLENVRIVMAGQFLDRGLKDAIESMPAVEFRGHVSWEESAHLAAGADAIFTFFDPRTEVNIRAASQKWYEALMVGRPILCNREIMNARWIQDNNIGFLSSYEIDDLIVTLRYMSEHRDEALSKGSHGRTLFEEGYNWAAMEKRLMCVAGRVMRA
jgi:glycosyltransferase involved in cell wall biosynthesis